MSWLYEQSTGRMYAADGSVAGVGYSGAGDCKNNCKTQAVHNEGPIPTGSYRIGQPIDTITHGPFVLPLTPDPTNQMFGRYGFLIHGDSVVNPGTASEGCIIMSRDVRNAIAESRDWELKVVAQL
jgi:hypothetical protein